MANQDYNENIEDVVHRQCEELRAWRLRYLSQRYDYLQVTILLERRRLEKISEYEKELKLIDNELDRLRGYDIQSKIRR